MIVGGSTVGLSGAEGYVIRQNTRFALLLSLLIGAVTLVWGVV